MGRRHYIIGRVVDMTIRADIIEMVTACRILLVSAAGVLTLRNRRD